ncbi:hypothetical protein Hanom_Chr01g00080161 [Helianthus anomalus]
MIGLICHLAVKFSTRGDFGRAGFSLHILIMSYLHGYKFIQLLSDPLSSHLLNTYFFSSLVVIFIYTCRICWMIFKFSYSICYF